MHPRWPLVATLCLACLLLCAPAISGATGPPLGSSGGEGGLIVQNPMSDWEGQVFDFVPPTPDPLTLEQPDGTSFKAVLTPAETGGQLETPDGYTIVRDEDGWWTFAVAGDPAPVPSDLIVGRDEPDGLREGVGQTDSIWLDSSGGDRREPLFRALKDAQSPNASLETAGSPAVRHNRYLVVLIEFQDVKFGAWQTTEYFEDQLSGLRNSPTGTLTDYFDEMSHGLFQPELDVVGPFTAPDDMAAYDYQLPGGKSVVGMVNDLGPQLLAAGIEWETYDNDKVVYTSGGTQYRSIDMVVFLHAGPDKAATGQAGHIWSHASTANYAVSQGEDGRQIRIRGVNTCPADGFNIGVVAHEMGHTIGEADYYDTSYRSMGTGDWDLMAGGSWMGEDPAGSNPAEMNPFSRINQGWIEPTVVTDTALGLQLQPRSKAADVLEIPLGGSGSGTTNAEERIYVEYVSNRAPGAIFDKAEYASGLLVWHYDRGGSQTKPTSSPARYRLGLEEYDFRDGTPELALNLNRGEPSDPWSATALGMTPYTTPSTDRNTPLTVGGTHTGWHLMNISPVGSSMSLDIVREADVQAKVGLDRPALADQPVIAGSGPAILKTKLYNLTAAPLSDVKVQFFRTVGQAKVLCADTTIASLPPGAPTAVTATWAAPVVGKWSIEARASVGAVSANETGIARVFARSAPVLIVDDDDGYTAEQAVEGALTALGIPYVLVERTASLALLQQFELVIWEAGQAGRAEGQLTKTEVADLKAWLNAGGRLWIMSPRLAAALGTPGTTPPPVDVAFLRDYLGASYPRSSQQGGGAITGLGQPIGGLATIQLSGFPGRSIQDFLDPAVSTIGAATPLFTWSFGHHLGVQVVGDASHNDFRVVYFGFNLSQVVFGADRLGLAQQVLDWMGVASVYFDKATYLVQSSTAVKVTVHDPDAANLSVKVASDAQPTGKVLALTPTLTPGTYAATVTIQKTASSSTTALRVGSTDTLRVEYEDRAGHTSYSSARVLLKTATDLPSTIYHDVIWTARDGAGLPVLAVVTDDIRVQQVQLYYRKAGTATYAVLPLAETFHGAYMATVPGSAVTAAGLEYYVSSRDSKGTVTSCGSPAAPIYVVVQPRTVSGG